VTPGGAASSAEEKGGDDRRAEAAPVEATDGYTTDAAELRFDRSIPPAAQTRRFRAVPGFWFRNVKAYRDVKTRHVYSRSLARNLSGRFEF
jgi:hypothetical protein